MHLIDTHKIHYTLFPFRQEYDLTLITLCAGITIQHNLTLINHLPCEIFM